MGLKAKFIYCHLSKGWPARAQDWVGNKVLKWATGVTRALAILKESSDPLELLAARHLLRHSNRDRANAALKQYEAKIETALGEALSNLVAQANPKVALDLLVGFMRTNPEALLMVGGRNPAAEILEYALKQIPAEKLAQVSIDSKLLNKHITY